MTAVRVEIGLDDRHERLPALGTEADPGDLARAQGGAIELTGYVGHPEGRPSLRLSASGNADQAAEVGRALAITMIGQGARPILDEVRSMERFP